MGWRPPTRITTPGVVLPREKPCLPLSADASIIVYLCGKVNILNISFMLQDFAPDDIMPHKIYYWQPTNRKEGNLDGNLPERDVLFFLERGENLFHNAGGIFVRERAVVRAQLEGERDALLAGGNTGAAVDIEEVDFP